MVVRQRSSILRQALMLISQPSNALNALRLIPPIWISHNFKATTLGMTRKTMRNRGFEPWTFRSCLSYQHFVINDNNRDQRKKDSKKTSIATVAEIKTEANVAEKASALVAATDHGDHMNFDSKQVSPLRPSSQKIVSTTNGNTTPVLGEGSLTLIDTLNLDFVLVVPSLDYNLLSVSQITTALSCIVIFWPEFCVIKDIQTRQTIGCGNKRGKLYYLDLQSKDSNKLQQALMADGFEGEKKKSEIWLWHRRLGHASFGYLKKIVRVLRSDNGGEYQSSDLQKYLEGHGIIHQTTCSNTPHQNGVAERKNRHLLEVVRASLIAAKTPISYWGKAITSVAYLINRVPSSSINFQTPLQALTNAIVAPTVPNLPPRVFGCVAFVHLLKHQRTKLTSHALQCVFVGYALHKKGYRCYHPPTRQMYITMDVVFHEDSMYFSSESELQGEYHKEIQTLDYDYHISKENESGQSELVNQEAGELDMSGQQFGSEDVFTEIPNQSSSVEGVLNLEPDPFMKRLPHRHNREFINEVATMGTIHHVNIVRLVGFCADRFKRALIYEYLPNESLEKFIFSRVVKNYSLSWKKLQEIAIGIAKGIEYLHQGCDQRILHFDIKPHNILLDHNFNPKISDFGLAKLCSKEQSAVSMTVARGTIGYIAPEVLSRNFGNVSYKSDVYSFGMLLLEMVGERKNIDVSVESTSQVYFPEWIYNHLDIGEELYIRIEEKGDVEIAKKLAIVGLSCIQWYPMDRPSMKIVVQMLEGKGGKLTIPPNPFASTTPTKTNLSKPRSAFQQELAIISEVE
ncbi:Rust resistance kinase Lr10 [Vitis vinifera]|uniref:Rust resistance kinase Lr10 n=1 Tax=Vitis vinifera TaxID=29760 RepID=A0A438HT05_VITVI|nr:Rust resistance kinase Lr10 [Vitis vinifera]